MKSAISGFLMTMKLIRLGLIFVRCSMNWVFVRSCDSAARHGIMYEKHSIPAIKGYNHRKAQIRPLHKEA
jgi:hypothetical protein